MILGKQEILKFSSGPEKNGATFFSDQRQMACDNKRMCRKFQVSKMPCLDSVGVRGILLTEKKEKSLNNNKISKKKIKIDSYNQGKDNIEHDLR